MTPAGMVRGAAPMRPPGAHRAQLGRLLDANGLVVVCGSGGVGKTTVAAALGAGVAARTTRKVLVLTVDPARRLATALGLDRALGNVPVRVEAASIEPAGGQLWMAMLDTKQSWDALVRRHAPDAATRDAILGNPLYQNITGQFVAAHDYIAAERLHELDASGDWDLIVVDTPPSRHALDFLEAPEPHGGVLRQPAAALADRALPLARCSTWPRSRSSPSPTGCSGRSS